MQGGLSARNFLPVSDRRLHLLLHTALDTKLTITQADHHATGRFLLRCPCPDRCRLFSLVNQHLNGGFILIRRRGFLRGVQFIETLLLVSAEFALRLRQDQIMFPVVTVVPHRPFPCQ